MPPKDKKGSKESSPKKDKSPPKDKKGKKDSPPNKGGKKDSPKKGKKGDEVKEEKVEIPERRKKQTHTDDLLPWIFENFRCQKCAIVFGSMLRFMNHTCWKKFYISEFHLGNTQALQCRTCDRVFSTDADYATHQCQQVVPEEVQPINYCDHLEFYMYWRQRIKREERLPHDTDWKFFCMCLKCGNRFKTKIHYMIHSCFLLASLEPGLVKSLKMCTHCKFVFLNIDQYNLHVDYCNKVKTLDIDFKTNVFERSCQQFVTGRHCYEEEVWRVNDSFPSMQLPNNLPVNCHTCGLRQASVKDFLYHPCKVGQLLPPYCFEMNLLCPSCQCLFMRNEEFLLHLCSCDAQNAIYVRLTLDEMRIALRRWHRENMKNPFLNITPETMMCEFCKEIFRTLEGLLKHACPRRKFHTRIFIQPSHLQELYICQQCRLFMRCASKAAEHRFNCTASSDPQCIQIHPSLEECIIALEPWSKMPKILMMDLSLGIPNIERYEVTLEDLMPPT